MSILESAEFIRAQRAIFLRFMVRDGYTAQQAIEEYNRLFVTVSLPVTTESRREYLFASRVGASFTLDRKARLSIVELYNNAGNHACAEIEARQDRSLD
jgi:hypothetical protein